MSGGQVPGREKFSTYYEIWDACYKSGCPICRLLDRRIHDYLESLMYEGVNTTSVRVKLRGALGFCRTHACKAIKLGDALGVAIIYEDLLQLVAKQLGEGQMPQQAIACPACSLRRVFEQSYGRTLLEFLEDDEFQQALQSCDGLCLAHLHQLSSQEKTIALPEWLLTLVRQKIQQRRRRLSEFLRKQDVQAKNERLSEGEATACEDAIDYLVGTTD